MYTFKHIQCAILALFLQLLNQQISFFIWPNRTSKKIDAFFI